MADLTDYEIYENKRFEVLTEKGFKDFKGIIKGKNNNKIILTLSNGEFLTCTPKHKLINFEKEVVYAKDIKLGDILYRGHKVISLKKVSSEDLVYELVHVEDTHTYFVNNILSHQCLLIDEMAFVDNGIVEAFWSAVYPTISSSTKAKILIASTPNGVGNRFHRLWDEKDNVDNDWGSLSVTWRDVPKFDDTWAKAQRITMGDDKFEQEFECKFLEGGDSIIPEDLYNELQAQCRHPIMSFDDDCYKVFAEPNLKERIYVAGVDIGEGIGKCASTLCVLDVTDLSHIEQVATYQNNTIDTYEFAKKLDIYLSHWGKPPVAIERNNTGGGVVLGQMEKQFNYPNLLCFAAKQGKLDFSHLKGVTSSTNTKVAAVYNMFYWLKSTKAVKLRDIDTLKELNTFVRYSSSKWAKKRGEGIYDDRVDALYWALICIHEIAVLQFFSVDLWDDNKKPLSLQPLYSVYDKTDANSIMSGNNGQYRADPLIISVGEGDPMLDELNNMGWHTLDSPESQEWSSYSPVTMF